MPIRPRRRLPVLPDLESGRIARPAHGATLAAIYDYQNHLAFVRRRAVHKAFSYDFSTITTTPIGTDQDLQIVIPSTPGTRGVFIGFEYQASSSPESASEVTTLGSPIDIKVDAQLYNHTTAALIDDPGCRWTFVDGHLVATVSNAELVPVPGILGAIPLEYGSAYAHTGTDPTIIGAGITSPRPLTVTDADAGDPLRVQLTTTNVRILRVDIWGLYTAEVEL